MRRAERSSAASKMALAIPSDDSRVIGEASYPCSLARRAPSSATDLANDSSWASRSPPPAVMKAPVRAKRVAIVSHTVSTTAPAGLSISSPAARRAPRDPQNRRNRTEPVRANFLPLPPVRLPSSSLRRSNLRLAIIVASRQGISIPRSSGACGLRRSVGAIGMSPWSRCRTMGTRRTPRSSR